MTPRKPHKLKKWDVYGHVTGSEYLGEYEAATAEEAEEMALKKNGYVGLCHQCSGEFEDVMISECTVEEADD